MRLELPLGLPLVVAIAAAAELLVRPYPEVFLTVRRCGSRNGCERGNGQGEGQNDRVRRLPYAASG